MKSMAQFQQLPSAIQPATSGLPRALSPSRGSPNAPRARGVTTALYANVGGVCGDATRRGGGRGGGRSAPKLPAYALGACSLLMTSARCSFCTHSCPARRAARPVQQADQRPVHPRPAPEMLSTSCERQLRTVRRGAKKRKGGSLPPP